MTIAVAEVLTCLDDTFVFELKSWFQNHCALWQTCYSCRARLSYTFVHHLVCKDTIMTELDLPLFFWSLLYSSPQPPKCTKIVVFTIQECKNRLSFLKNPHPTGFEWISWKFNLVSMEELSCKELLLPLYVFVRFLWGTYIDSTSDFSRQVSWPIELEDLMHR